MKNSDTKKQIVKARYAAIAIDPKKRCCCVNKEPDFTAFSLDYSQKEGYMEDADLNLGCGIPTEYAGIETGNSLLDLDSGAGNDCFVASAIQKYAYMQIIHNTGFKNMEITAKQNNSLSDEVLLIHVSQEVVDDYLTSGTGIFSITVVGYR